MNVRHNICPLVMVATDSMIVEDRLRPIDPLRVTNIAESIKEIGLQQPIGVYTRDDGKRVLVTGAHRLAAVQQLGQGGIRAFDLSDMSAADRELWEVDENLQRKELSPDEFRSHLIRRREIWEKQQAEKNSGTSDPLPKKPGRPKEFAASTAKALGVSKRTINRTLADPKPKPPAPAPAATPAPATSPPPSSPSVPEPKITMTREEGVIARIKARDAYADELHQQDIDRAVANAREEWAAEREGLLQQLADANNRIAMLEKQVAAKQKHSVKQAASISVENGIDVAP
jgi:uncharacterized ParB-like nuclease family protein